MECKNQNKTLNVSDTAKSTNTLSKSMKNTIQTTLTMGMQQNSEQKNSLTLTSWLEDFLAKLSVYVDTDSVSMTQGELSFLKSQGFSKTKDPNIFYS